MYFFIARSLNAFYHPLPHLRYSKHTLKNKNALGAIRTRNLLLRKQVLYPLSYEGKLL